MEGEPKPTKPTKPMRTGLIALVNTLNLDLTTLTDLGDMADHIALADDIQRHIMPDLISALEAKVDVALVEIHPGFKSDDEWSEGGYEPAHFGWVDPTGKRLLTIYVGGVTDEGRRAEIATWAEAKVQRWLDDVLATVTVQPIIVQVDD